MSRLTDQIADWIEAYPEDEWANSGPFWAIISLMETFPAATCQEVLSAFNAPWYAKATEHERGRPN